MDKFDWNDLALVPAILSTINSRKEISILDENGKLPIFVSPMDTVIDENNYKLFLDNNYNVCLVRGMEYLNMDYTKCFVSFSIDEVSVLYESGNLPPRVLIDVANGHQDSVYKIAKKIKVNYPKVELMVGNIANPLTYNRYSEIGVDWTRIGIGGGQACFIGNMLVTTKNGKKFIKDIIIGDYVLTHNNDYKEVINKISYKTQEELININDNISTIDHKYYVLNKKYMDIVNDDNIHDYAEWIESEKLNKDIHLLIQSLV